MTFFSLPIVLDAVAKASVILAATALVAAALRRASASARHFVWTLGLLSALAAPALSVALPRWELPIVTIAPPAAPAARRRPSEISRQHPLAESAVRRFRLHGGSRQLSRQRGRAGAALAARDAPRACAAVVAGDRVVRWVAGAAADSRAHVPRARSRCSGCRAARRS